MVACSVSDADPDPESGAFLTSRLGSGIRNRFIPDLLQNFKNKTIFSFVKFVATKKDMTTNFFSPLSFVAVFDPG
jgi:hypothetical protein